MGLQKTDIALMDNGSTVEVEGWEIALLAVILLVVGVLVTIAVVRAHHKPVTTGKEGLIGQTAVALTDLVPEGTVFVEGERWKAISKGERIGQGEEVMIVGVKRLQLEVTKK